MIHGKVKDLLKVKNLPQTIREEIERKRLSDKFPKSDKEAAQIETYQVFPDGNPCLFFYDEENEILLFSMLSTYYGREAKSFLLTYSVMFYYRDPVLKGRFRCMDMNCFPPFPFRFESKDIPEIRGKSAKVRSILARAAKLLPDADKISKFLQNAVD